MVNRSNLILSVIVATISALVALACGTIPEGTSDPMSDVREPYQVSTDFAVVTPTSVELPEGWWNPIDEKQLRDIEYSYLGIKMWGNCVWYFDDPNPDTEEAVRTSLAAVIDSPAADQLGIIQGADLDKVCEESAAVADVPVEVSDGRRAAIASDMMIDLLDSCVAFYEAPDAALGYRIAITFIDMLWMLELDTPRWPRRDFWGVREWCDGIVEGAVAS